MSRKLSTIAIACLALAALSHSKAQAQFYYHAYTAGTSTCATEQCSYLVMDQQNISTRNIYLSYYNNTTGVYCHTNDPAGNQIASVTISAGCMDYTGVMYCGKKLCAFQFTVCTDTCSLCGWAVHFTLKDKRTGAVLINRYDLLDANSAIICNP